MIFIDATAVASGTVKTNFSTYMLKTKSKSCTDLFWLLLEILWNKYWTVCHSNYLSWSWIQFKEWINLVVKWHKLSQHESNTISRSQGLSDISDISCCNNHYCLIIITFSVLNWGNSSVRKLLYKCNGYRNDSTNNYLQ